MSTDAQIFRDIVAVVSGHPDLRSARLKFEVTNGDVTISGRVKSFTERKALKRAVSRVVGIRTLALDIRAEEVPIIGRFTAGDVATTLMRRLVAESIKI